jgi:translocation protein SEC63
MANYHYDEAGNMAAYFLITFLALILTPLTFSLSPGSKKPVAGGCQCRPCIEQRLRAEKCERGSLLNPKLSKKSIFIIAGWILFAYISYKVAGAKIENKVYDPFEVLGLRAGVSEKEIKSHFKKLSRMYHPDKVKVSVNETIEAIANRFVDITKAYKSLTDQTIRKNWELYGHPDGRQEVSMGIALPHWIIEGKNNKWVLGVYALIFGGALPILVGSWWFGSRQKTKDGINALSAAAFFKSLKEESGMDEVVGTLGKAFEWDSPKSKKNPKKIAQKAVNEVEAKVQGKMGSKWPEIRRLADAKGPQHECRRRSLVLLYAHLLRIPLSNGSLQREQTELLSKLPHMLNALLTVSISRNWLSPTLAVMRLHAYLAQALAPGNERLKFAQLPGIRSEEVRELAVDSEVLEDFVQTLETNGDERIEDVKTAIRTWGRLELVDASFKVIGERLVTPSAIVFLVVKLRLSPPRDPSAVEVKSKEDDVDEIKRTVKANEDKDLQFLNDRKDAEDMADEASPGWAHAPYWPGKRKLTWWVVLADDKTNRVVVPPMKISDIPFSNSSQDRNYRSYKLQFQAPQSTGMFTWKIYLVSDTFVGEEISRDIVVRYPGGQSLRRLTLAPLKAQD